MQFDFTNGPDVLNCGGQCSNIVVHDCLSYEGQSGSAIWSTVRFSLHPLSDVFLSRHSSFKASSGQSQCPFQCATCMPGLNAPAAQATHVNMPTPSRQPAACLVDDGMRACD